MSRILFVVPPLAGHINPAVAVATELTALGHQVAWVGQRGALERMVGAKAAIFPCAGPESIDHRPRDLRGVAALKYLWEDFFAPLAIAMAPGITAAVLEFGPDLLVVDQQTVAGALVAERLGVPYVTSSTTSAQLSGSLMGMPKVEEWIADLLDRLRQRLGDPSKTYDPCFSPRLTVCFSTTDLTGPQPTARGPVRFVGPAIGKRPPVPGFPWKWLDQGGPETSADARRLVLVTLGTANSALGKRFLAECVDVVRARAGQVRAVVVDPGGVLGEPAADPDVLVVPAVPQLELLPRTDAVICHAGHNTVVEALWHGVPLVVAPIRDDQPVIAGQVTASGAGLRVRFGRSDGNRIGAVLDRVLHEPQFAAAAQRLSEGFRAAGGAAAAAAQIEELAVEEEEDPWHELRR